MLFLGKVAEPTDYQRSLADAVKRSAASAARYAEARDFEHAKEALRRAQRSALTLASSLPSHARLRRMADEAVRLAERCIEAPAEQESDETGEIVKVRERLSTRTVRASARS